MIDAIDRNVELQRQIALEPADVERQDESAIVVRDELRQTSQQLRALENLPRERSRRGGGREEAEPGARAGPRQRSQQLGALENLPRERSRRVVVRTQQLDPTSRVVG